MAFKYRVSQTINGKTCVFGNFPAFSAEEAVLKAYSHNGKYSPFDFSKPFDIKKGSYVDSIMVEAPNV